MPRNGSVRAISWNSSQCELTHIERSECQTSSAWNSWNGTRKVYSNVTRTTSPASSENECWFLGELVAARTQKVSILAFSSSFGEKQENELSRTSKSIEAKKYLDFGNFRPVSVKTRKRARWHSRPVEVQNK